jgi:Ulp1 family protease
LLDFLEVCDACSFSPAWRPQAFKRTRKVLEEEWKHHNPGEAVPVIDNTSVPGQNVKVPIQQNEYDCGLFMLHSVEFLAKSGGNMPMPPVKGMLSNCYEAKDIETDKRTQIQDIMRSLRTEDGQSATCQALLD